MSKFFKSAAFPILIVVVLAFFAQKLISPGDRTPDPNYSEFLTQVDTTRPPIRTTQSRTSSTSSGPRTSPST